MEQQLQNPTLVDEQEQLPPTPKLLTYKGEAVVTLLILEKLIGIDHATALSLLKVKQIPYVHLAGESLRAFKRENGYMNSASNLVIINKPNAFILLKESNRDYTVKIALLSSYFDNLLDTREKCMNTVEVVGLLCLSKVFKHIADRDVKSFASIAIAKALSRLGVWDLPISDEDDFNSSEGWNKIAIPNNCWDLLSLGRTVSRGELDNRTRELARLV